MLFLLRGGDTCEQFGISPVPHVGHKSKWVSFRLFANTGIKLPVVILVKLVVLYRYREDS